MNNQNETSSEKSAVHANVNYNAGKPHLQQKVRFIWLVVEYATLIFPFLLLGYILYQYFGSWIETPKEI